MAQLAEQLLPTIELRSSNLLISEIYSEHLFTVNYIKKTKIKTKRLGMADFF